MTIALGSAGCGGEEGEECGTGTHEENGICLPDSTITCAEGTHEEDGECVSDLACGPGTSDVDGICVPDDEIATGPVTSADWVGQADWDTATTVNLAMVEGATDYSFSPSTMTFEVGKPYILHITSAAGAAGKHYFFSETFFRSIAIRKAQTPDAEYKAPYFTAFELKTGGTEIDLYFVPVLKGDHSFHCTIGNHSELGMNGVITIVENTDFPNPQLDQELDPAWTGGDPRTSGGHFVWAYANTDYNTGGSEGPITMVEGPGDALAYSPDTLSLVAGTAYKLRLENPSGNTSKHYYTATNFYKSAVLRKAEDSNAEIKAPYLNAVEVLIGGAVELFLVPDAAGDYGTVCTIPGHAEDGMVGTIKVAPEGMTGQPVTSAEWVGVVDWSTATEVEMTMIEGGATDYSYSPSTLSFEVGKPYILRIINPMDAASKHYFYAPDFFRALAIRKAQTADAEYKAPYFTAFELVMSSVSDREIELYFVPVIAGTYEFHCTIGGHATGGMVGTINITPNSGISNPVLDQQLDPSWVGPDPRTSSGHTVWDDGNVNETYFAGSAITMTELGGGDLAFAPTEISLTEGVAYKLGLSNPAGNGKHYFTATTLYKTMVWRKVEDSHAEIKAPYMNAVELRANATTGTATTLFVVPTVAGDYGALCTITGHAAAGMIGDVNVSAP